MPLIEQLISFNKKHRVLSHILFWIFLFVLFTVRFDPYQRYKHNFLNELLDWSLTLSIVAIYAYYIAYRFIPRLFSTQRYLPVILECIIVSYAVSVIFRTLVIYFLEPITRKPPFGQEPISEILLDVSTLFHQYFLHMLAISFFFVFTKMIKDQYLINKRALQLEKQKSESELIALKAQLNPHFLFNTLNNIYSLTLLQSPSAPGAVAKLSDILDHLLYRCSDMYVPISKEIELLQNYIGLEKMRYDERLQVNFNYSTDKDSKIAPLILLSLAENAFKHGAGEDAGNPVIDILVQLKNNVFFFEVSNSVTATKEKNDNDRIGLANIRKQLELIYPEVHTFKTSLQDGRFTASLQIHLPKEEQ